MLKLAASKWLSEAEYGSLYRERVHELDAAVWSDVDAPLLDEARALLGPKPPSKAVKAANARAQAEGLPPLPDDEIRTYGHIVIDEVQDLSPMALRMTARRSLNGAMTVVGDLAQSTGQHAPRSWDDVLGHLPDRKPARITELTVGYRIPESIMDLANKVLAAAVPSLTPPRAVRTGESHARIIATNEADRAATIADLVRELRDTVDDGMVAVVTPASLTADVAAALGAAGIVVGNAAGRLAIDEAINVVPVSLVKGLELDAVVVVEPGRIIDEESQGLRALYVALTRSTKELAVVHADPLPDVLAR